MQAVLRDRVDGGPAVGALHLVQGGLPKVLPPRPRNHDCQGTIVPIYALWTRNDWGMEKLSVAP